MEQLNTRDAFKIIESNESRHLLTSLSPHDIRYAHYVAFLMRLVTFKNGMTPATPLSSGSVDIPDLMQMAYWKDLECHEVKEAL